MPARLGQHFLLDASVRDRILECAQVEPGRCVLEIGPGRGALTRALLAKGARVTAVEMDERLAAALQEQFAGRPEFRLLRADFLRLDLSRLEAEYEEPWRVAANLPYSVAAPILQKLLGWERWDEAALMFQKEVALRVAAEPGSADYGILTLATWLHAEAAVLFEVGPEAFSPPPKVDSAVVRLRRRQKPMVDPAKHGAFFRVAKAAFGQRRKMAQTPLAQAFGISKSRAAEILRDCGLDPSCRAQDIPPESYALLADKFAIFSPCSAQGRAPLA